MGRRVLVAMSGGVDSSVAAYLLQREGYDVIGAFLRLGEGGHATTTDKSRGCCTVEDAIDARRVADRLGIPFYSFNYAESFRRVIDYFVAEYQRGRTPNPCARCNQWIKFDTFHGLARDLDAELVATGHYAQTTVESGSGSDRVVALRRGGDVRKDQSYFLAMMPYSTLAECLFPVGGLTKPEVRELAAEAGLPVVHKRESMEICFVPGNDYRRIIEAQAPGSMQTGDIVDTDGNTVGRHEGYQRFTIGQRRGVGVAAGEPRYVLNTDPATNRVTIGTAAELARGTFRISEPNWLLPAPPSLPLRASVQIRYRSTPAPALVDAGPGGQLEVTLDEPRLAVAAGQAAVIYDGDRVLGGGWIETS